MKSVADVRLADFTSLRYSGGGLPATRLISQPPGAILAWAACRLGLSPSAVTLLGLSAFVAGAWLYAALPGGWAYALGCLLLFQLGYVLDCADGQLARATNTVSTLGAWLDLACDYLRNILVTGGMLLWLVRSGVTLESAVLACGLLLAGTTVHLHTISILRRAGARSGKRWSGTALTARTAATSALDTPVILLCIALLRMLPDALAAYAALLGVLYGLMIWAVIRVRLQSGET